MMFFDIGSSYTDMHCQCLSSHFW